MALRAARRSWTSPVTRCGRAPRRARVCARARRASEASEGSSEGVWGVQGAADAAWEAAGRDEAARAKVKDAQRRKDMLRAAAAGETARTAEGGRKGATGAQGRHVGTKVRAVLFVVRLVSPVRRRARPCVAAGHVVNFPRRLWRRASASGCAGGVPTGRPVEHRGGRRVCILWRPTGAPVVTAM